MTKSLTYTADMRRATLIEGKLLWSERITIDAYHICQKHKEGIKIE